jgi:hypothetical protein
MAKRRTATRVTLNEAQHDRLERLWFIYGNYGPKTTPGNHQFIQGLLEHGLDLRPLLTKRTAKKDVPTAECVAEVEKVLTSTGGTEDRATRSPVLRLVTPPIGEHKIVTPDPELKRMLDEMRRRLSLSRGRGENDADGKDAA